ncbi:MULTISPECIES: hypothetical protein [unclassified Actinopolyspora]|uniref:hypothetical protein n=1 Tax=unclassified Actinopolyspora TaxID=2639451 RepID=UPI0013F5CB43|nr:MULTISPECIES: hypothetical protein [unclassified Actinopolyspora]NHD16344.1 hypothetical protein [Actinopolyspora sp. BKK2]NHE75793.1 hypothetical protein [Actinopolyspora sp. BKK1]
MGLLTVPTQAAPSSAMPVAGGEDTARVNQVNDTVEPKKRDEVLPKGWQQSDDLSWTTSGDSAGFHILTAESDSGYSWRTVATLSEPGIVSDRWIGNVCVTGSGHRAVAVYAPRTFTNEQPLVERGAFTAVVNLVTGEVDKIPLRSSMAYFNPACGTGEQAVLTQEGHEKTGKTRLVRLDAASGELSPVVTDGQVTSAVPTRHGIVAARGSRLIRVGGSGKQHELARAASTPFRMRSDSAGGVVFQERSQDDERVRVRRWNGDVLQPVASGKLGEVRVRSGKGGSVFVTGQSVKSVRSVPGPVRMLSVPANAQPSTTGEVVVTGTELSNSTSKKGPTRPRPGRTEAVNVHAKVLRTGAELDFKVTPESQAASDTEASAPHPNAGLAKPGDSVSPKAGGAATDPVDQGRTCSVPRNDPETQVYQPTPRQVEWAVNQAVQHDLHPSRPDDWKGSGLQAWDPQEMFPPIPLEGGGEVPAQIMLGVLTQESNMSQASWHVKPGVTGNPLIGNYYGRDVYDEDPSNDWDINFAEADCGYGMSQVTDHMRLEGHEKPDGLDAWPMRKQRAVALDYATNLVAGMQILQKKWNATRRAGMTLNNGDSSKIENWFYALWAYNSGFYPKGQHASGQWGVGWFNNPINPRYPADRDPFLEETYHDASHPQDWPYPEKVIGWAGHPLANEDGAGYRAAWWNSKQYRYESKPPIRLFCNSSNSCDPADLEKPCQRDDYRCWYHESTSWKTDCDTTCGNGFIRFDTSYPEQPDGTNYPPVCDLGGLPDNALVVDDVADSVDSIRPNCGRPWNNAGEFGLKFASDTSGNYPSKIDFHQIGAGFGGHFWFAHTRKPGALGGKMKVTGTWTLDRERTGPMKIMAALPDHGAHTRIADYRVNATRGPGGQVTRQPGDGVRWVSIGTYMFDGVVPKVTLSSETPHGTGENDIAFDAMAFIPIDGQYHEETVEADALFDEDQNINTAAPDSWINQGPLQGMGRLHDWAMNMSDKILSMKNCDSEVGDCLTPNVGEVVANWRSEVKAAGTDPDNHPPGNSIASWIGFANSYKDRPDSNRRPDSFDDDSRYKIKTKATVTFVTGENGKIIAGSEHADYSHRTADTHMPHFALQLIRAVAEDYGLYGVSLPDLSYRAEDLNEHNGEYTTVRPLQNGIIPGRAYAYAGKAPKLTSYKGTGDQRGATCVAARTTAGGIIGYRPLLSKKGPTDAMYDFSEKLQNTPEVAQSVWELVENIREMFFDRGPIVGAESSIYNVAPPIWQDLSFRACADGTIKQTNGRPVLRASWMPDHYLYHNDVAMDLSGNNRESSGPLLKGDFKNFSKSQNEILHEFMPYWGCNEYVEQSMWDRNGNPWGVNPTHGPGFNPSSMKFCSDPDLKPDARYSSPGLN